MRRDSNNSLSSSSSHHHHRHHQCPVISRLYLSVDGDLRRSCDDDIGVAHREMRYVSSVCRDSSSSYDDVFCAGTHVDDHRQRRLFHAWAQYRIAQRGIMVSQSLLCRYLL